MTAEGTPRAVLVVDDEESIRNPLKKFLEQQKYEVHAAASAAEALEVLRKQKVHVALFDIRMPGTSGIDLVPQALEVDPDLAILMLSAVNDATTAALCMQRGAMDYLTKPIELVDLNRAVQRALKRRDMTLEGHKLQDWLHDEVKTRGAEVSVEQQKLHQLQVATLEALINAMEAKDPYLRGHSARVADLAATIASHMQLDDEVVDQVRLGGRLHDLGKIGTRDEVSNKEGPLTPEEYEHVKQHVVIGVQILSPLPLGPVIEYVRTHHERWDGSGYPDGLRGENIPIGGRIVGAAEVYDALTTSRPYQQKMEPDEAVERMRELAGSVLDPKVYDALLLAVKRRKSLVFLDDLPA